MFNLQIPKKSFFGAAIGTMIEYYDYALFIIFLPIMSPLFFPASTPYQSLMKGYFILLIAMLARPLGGLLFGYIGDIFGRRKALLGSMYGIAIVTFLMGVTPSYETLGIWAIVIITLAKAIQLFCFGGELNGAGIYVVEHAQNKNEILTGSLLLAVTLMGSVLASMVGVILTAQFMPSWSWRIAFILGGLIGVFGILYRKNLLESPNFSGADLKFQGTVAMFKQYPKELCASLFIGALVTTPFTTIVAFINPVLMTKGMLTSHHLMWLQAGLILTAVITLIIFGKVVDGKSTTKIMQAGCWLITLACYPVLLLIDHGSMPVIILALMALIITNEIFLTPSNAYLKNLFTMQYRYRAVSLSFCLGMSIFGGLTPVVEGYLYKITGHFSSIAVWLALISMCTYVAMDLVRRKNAVINLAKLPQLS